MQVLLTIINSKIELVNVFRGMVHSIDYVIEPARVLFPYALLFFAMAISIALHFVQLKKRRNLKRMYHTMQSQMDALNHQVDLLKVTVSGQQEVKMEPVVIFQPVEYIDVEKLISKPILTEEDWLDFQKHFDEMNPGVIEGFTAQCNNLTQADLRYLLLAYLNLSHKEMASMLGISSDSLRVTWYRLRKKLDLSSDVNVSDYIEELRNNDKQLKHTLAC